MSVPKTKARRRRVAFQSSATLILLGVLTLGGCSMVPEYRQPELPLAQQWNAASGGQSAAGGQWWREFHSAELDQLIDRGSPTAHREAETAKAHRG